MRFEFATATKIMFGAGRVKDAVAAAASLGRRALVVSGGTPSRLDSFVRDLRAKQVDCTPFSISGEPTLAAVAEGARIANKLRCELVIGFGGGSPLLGSAVDPACTNLPVR